MTAPFAADLSGYRDKGTPNVSDAGQTDSITWSKALFDHLAIPADRPAAAAIGVALDEAITTLTALPADPTVARVVRLLRDEARRSAADHIRIEQLLANMPEESLLKLDIAIGDRAEPARLLLGCPRYGRCAPTALRTAWPKV